MPESLQSAMRRLMWSVLGLAALVLVASGSAAGAPATGWRVSGTITGTYENEHGWVSCGATGEAALLRQTVRVDVRLRPAFVARFDRQSGMVARFKVTVAGTWTLTGSYPPLQYPLGGGDPTCGPQVPVDCAGPVINPYRDNDARLEFSRVGARAVGYFNSFVEIVEIAAFADPDPAKPFCSQSGSEPTQIPPLFGLASTDIEDRAVPSTFPVRVPVPRLLGHRAFNVVVPSALPNGCQTGYHTPCRESGRLTMRLSFTPTRR
jgi:hypothetical protein